MTFATSITLPDLGLGAGYALWGFRAAAIGDVERPVLQNGFEAAFGDYGLSALGGLHSLARELGVSGGRQIKIACPGCAYATADELSIVMLLSAAQEEDEALCVSHLYWLMCGRGEEAAHAAALGVATVFKAAGVTIRRPQIEVRAASGNKTFMSFHPAGRA
ncbi:MAG: hypothetical protein AAGC95_18195 [Pseudomonadota bacterium]